MGQYWMPVNLDKKECIQPHKLGTGLKLWEQLANHPGTGSALVILCAAMPEARGGGDFDLDENWHGPERTFPAHNISPGPMPEDYTTVAKRTIGRWAGDRIALVGDYAENSDLAPEHKASTIYSRTHAPTRTVVTKRPPKDGRFDYRYQDGNYVRFVETRPAKFRDITDDVVRVIEHELRGKYEGDGWREGGVR